MNLGFSNSLLASSSHMLLHHIGIYLIRVTSLLLILLVSPLQFYNILNHLLIASSLLCIMTTHCGHSKIMYIHSLSPDWPSLCPVSLSIAPFRWMTALPESYVPGRSVFLRLLHGSVFTLRGPRWPRELLCLETVGAHWGNSGAGRHGQAWDVGSVVL